MPLFKLEVVDVFDLFVLVLMAELGVVTSLKAPFVERSKSDLAIPGT